MRTTDCILVTGGAGFIGSCFIRTLLRKSDFLGKVINYDLLTYAANLDNLNGFHEHPRYRFIQGNILNQSLVESIIEEEGVDTIVHFAAETHVDRSIADASPFILNNVQGTLSLLEAAIKFEGIHFHHISTDEVYGSLGESGYFTERSQYRPNSPYSASKAASDHLVRAFAQTYGLSTTVSHCSNNYGPGQHKEKLIPLIIHNCLKKKSLPIYGKGANVRDWIYVEDHVEAIWTILKGGKKGQTYDVGGKCEMSNLQLVRLLLEIMDGRKEKKLESLIRFVEDRKGHDFRYAIDNSKIEQELDFTPKTPIIEGLKKTVHWYLKKVEQQTC